MTGSFHKQDPVGVPDQGYNYYKAKRFRVASPSAVINEITVKVQCGANATNNRETILLIVTAKKAIIRSRFYSISNKVLC